MNLLVNEPQLGPHVARSLRRCPRTSGRASGRGSVGLLRTLGPQTGSRERRGDHRYPFPHLIHLTPVGDDGITPTGETVVVVGKHLSERGVGFYHPKPLPYRRMIVSLEAVPARGSRSSST